MANDSVTDLAAWAGKRASAGDVIGPAPPDDGRTVSLWAETPGGAVAMSATATLAA
ncbi:MAG: hypothetical protein IIA01_05090 [Proteobacteria bacterium]|nr:hypothetical protein [Pseudomonadota bacterium]